MSFKSALEKTYFNESYKMDLNSSFNPSNMTTLHDPWEENVKHILNNLLLLFLIIIMLAMGCEITLSNLWGHLKRPIGLSIGIISQFVIMPLTAYSVLIWSGVSGRPATGTLIILCSPGGPLSNTFTYFCDGDLSLSVAMTTASTIMAMGMLPANMWLYGRHFESVDLVIPYRKMALSLIIVVSPVVVGLLLRWKLPTVAKWTTKIGTCSGLLLMFICGVIEAMIFPSMFTSVPLKMYAIILCLPVVGLAVGYFVSTLLRQSVPVRKTISIECSVQNFPLALSVITLSFPLEMQEGIALFPWLYGIAMISGCTVLCVFYHIFKKIQQRKMRRMKIHTDPKNGLDTFEREDLVALNGIHIETKPAKNSIKRDTDCIKI